MKYRPKVGKDFPLELEVQKERRRLLRETTRSLVALSVITCFVVLLLIGVGISLTHGNFEFFGRIWAMVSGPMGIVIGHYFKIDE